MKFQSAKFVTTVVSLKEAPNFYSFPEIAVLGRSNVGKSTLLNHLFRAKNLVKTSSQPGKTRALNFFLIDEKFVFVDLPGYGFAKVSKGEKAQWSRLIEDYLHKREQLKVLILLLDIRHTPSIEDEKMLEWIKESGLPAIVVLTKVDKLNQSERAKQTKQITSRLKDLPYVHYSATKNIGRKELIAILSEMVHHVTP
ncbi:MAG: putative GTP-binding protein EngB [Chlamydiales bacterium]|nr:putative GTP-binding protein EngB [Chlamydiales bacterium]